MALCQSQEIERSRLLLYGTPRPLPEPGGPPAPAAPAGRLRALLKKSGLSPAAVRAYYWRAGGGLVLLILTGCRACGMAALLLAGAAAGLEYLRLNRIVFKRAEAFESDYPALLLSLASGIRTGLDPLIAMRECAALFRERSLLRREIELFTERISGGASEHGVRGSGRGGTPNPPLPGPRKGGGRGDGTVPR